MSQVISINHRKAAAELSAWHRLNAYTIAQLERGLTVAAVTSDPAINWDGRNG
jgi:hypothetical protein